MRRKTKPYEAYLDRQLRDPEGAAAYLSTALAEAHKKGGIQLFLLALRDVARANNLTKVAGKSAKSRTSLYKALSESGDPKFSTILDILAALEISLDLHANGEEKAAGASELWGKEYQKRILAIKPAQKPRARHQ